LKKEYINPRSWFSRNALDPEDEDQTPLEDRIPTSWWTSGLVFNSAMCCAILTFQFHMNVGEAILSLILGFLFSFVIVQSSGTTGLNPVSTVSKTSQLIFGGIGKATHLAANPARTLNLTAGVVAAGSAAQASDMTDDLKTGYFLRAKPRNQFIAQLVGATVAVILTSGLFILFTKASPCILHPPESGQCTYGTPAVSSWLAVAVAVTSPSLPIPPSSWYTAIALCIISIISLIIKVSSPLHFSKIAHHADAEQSLQRYWIPKKYWGWVPNWTAVGSAFVLPQVYYSFAMAVGSTVNWFWLKNNPLGYNMYMFAIAAGLLAGEGLGGVFQALLAVIGIDGGKYGTSIGCPGFEFCS